MGIYGCTCMKGFYTFWFAFFLITLLIVVGYIYTQVSKKFLSTIEFTKDEIIYKAKNKTVKMRWEDIDIISLTPRSFWASFNRIVTFVAYDCPYKYKNYRNKEILNKKIWSEYDDDMLEEIKKYWDGVIQNEREYIKYKNRRKRLRK